MKGSSDQLSASNEQELWKKFQLEGDEKSLSVIYSRYFDQLYHYGSRFTTDNTIVEDCIQELFIKLIRNRQNLSVPASVKNYLFKAFRSFIFDKMESQKKYKTGEINEMTGFELEPSAEPGIFSQEEPTERQKKLQHAMQQLTARQREAIYLKYAAGFSYPEIAAMLSLTQKATYKLVARAIGTLRSAIVEVLVICSLWTLW